MTTESGSGGEYRMNIPVPDPSEATSREIERTRVELRLEMDQRLKALGRLIDEKLLNVATRFNDIEVRFAERDTRNKELSQVIQNNTTEAIHKSEVTFGGRIAALEALLSATKDVFAERVGEVARRLDRSEGGIVGERAGTRASQANMANMIGAIGGLVAVISLLGMLIFNSLERSEPTSPPVGIDSKRVDDLVSRLNALSQRIDSGPVAPAIPAIPGTTVTTVTPGAPTAPTAPPSTGR